MSHKHADKEICPSINRLSLPPRTHKSNAKNVQDTIQDFHKCTDTIVISRPVRQLQMFGICKGSCKGRLRAPAGRHRYRRAPQIGTCHGTFKPLWVTLTDRSARRTGGSTHGFAGLTLLRGGKCDESKNKTKYSSFTWPINLPWHCLTMFCSLLTFYFFNFIFILWSQGYVEKSQHISKAVKNNH